MAAAASGGGGAGGSFSGTVGGASGDLDRRTSRPGDRTGESLLGARFRFAVGVDGSDVAYRSFKTVLALRKKGDEVHCIHVSDPTKDYLPYDLRPSSIAEFYDTECVSQIPSKDYKIIVKSKRPGEGTKEALCAIVNKDSAYDFLVVGMSGRKGPKEDPTILGSTVDYSLRQAHMSSIIVKNHDFPDKAIFLVGVDGSESANYSVNVALALAKPTDEVRILHIEDRTIQSTVSEPFRVGAVRARYEALAASDPRVAFVCVLRDGSKLVADIINAYAVEEGITYVLIGADGVGAYASGKKNWMGSVSDRVVRYARCTVIVTQPKAAVIRGK